MPKAEEADDAKLWSMIAPTRDPAQVRLFLGAYPNSPLAADAQALLAELEAAAQPVPATPQIPAEAEEVMIERAMGERTAEAFQAYLDAYPQGVFADLARTELAALATGSGNDPVGKDATPPKPEETVVERPADDRVTFRGPLYDPGQSIHGRSLADLIQSSPEHPPFEGVPDEMWKGQTCSNCHQWDEVKLCDQAKTYVTRGVASFDRIPHPFGGRLKRAMANWAAADCPEQ